MRKLASVQQILYLDPIEGADKIEVATVNGWEVIVKKGVHKAGDMVCFFEVDSFIPVKGQYQLPDSIKKTLPNIGEGYRIKTIKLRDQISQGFIMPLRELEELKPMLEVAGFEEGFDLTGILGVHRWEPPVTGGGDIQSRGNFPSEIPKTDEERVQNVICKRNREGKLHIAGDYEVTLKLDGSSMTVALLHGEGIVCSRRLMLDLEVENNFTKTVKNGHLINKVKAMSEFYGSELAVQGELIGEGIQGNREKIEGHQFFVFNVYSIKECRYLMPDERRSLCTKFGFNHVPVLDSCFQVEDKDDLLADLLKKSEIKSIKHPIAEGLVYKSLTEQDKSFKVINNKYLLKEK